MINHLHGDELTAEWKDVQVHLDPFVHLEDLWQRHAFAPPRFDLEDRSIVSSCCDSCRKNVCHDNCRAKLSQL